MVLSFVIPVVGECVGVTVLGMLVAVLVDAADAGRVTGVVVFDVAVERVVEVVNSGVLAVVGDSTSSPEPTSPSTIAKIFEVVFDRVVEGVLDTLVSSVVAIVGELVEWSEVLTVVEGGVVVSSVVCAGEVTGVVIFDVVVEGVVDVVDSGVVASFGELVDRSEVLTFVEGEVDVSSDVYAEEVTGVLAVVGDSTSSPEPTSPEPTSPWTIAKISEVVFDRVASGVVDTLGILGIVEGVDGMLDAVLPEVLEVVCVDAVNKKLFVR